MTPDERATTITWARCCVRKAMNSHRRAHQWMLSALLAVDDLEADLRTAIGDEPDDPVARDHRRALASARQLLAGALAMHCRPGRHASLADALIELEALRPKKIEPAAVQRATGPTPLQPRHPAGDVPAGEACHDAGSKESEQSARILLVGAEDNPTRDRGLT